MSFRTQRPERCASASFARGAGYYKNVATPNGDEKRGKSKPIGESPDKEALQEVQPHDSIFINFLQMQEHEGNAILEPA